jgi:hypothetical protein
MPRRIASSVGLVLAASMALGACNASTSTTPSPAPTASASTTPAPTETAPATSSSASDVTFPPEGSATQTDTEWGRIWDEIPRSFPVYPGATATTDIGPPVSAEFVIPADVKTATTWTKTALDASGLRTSVSGPLEDGSMTLDSVGPNGCAAKTTIARTGGLTLLTILYGAKCPTP